MTRAQLLEALKRQRAEFDARVENVPAQAFDSRILGCPHTPKQIVAHVSAYERLIVERLRAARLGERTEFDRDRVGWESFNDRIWRESAEKPADAVLADSARDFLQLLEEVGLLGDEELVSTAGVTASIDPAWLQGRTLAQVIGVDAFDHYEMHFEQLESAAGGPID